jgi:hypothetical protein
MKNITNGDLECENKIIIKNKEHGRNNVNSGNGNSGGGNSGGGNSGGKNKYAEPWY